MSGVVYRQGKPFRDDLSALSVSTVKVVLVMIGVLIGASTGLWVAARTMPLPSVTTQYIVR